MKAGILAVHRYLGVGLALFWILQALTGVALVFHARSPSTGVVRP